MGSSVPAAGASGGGVPMIGVSGIGNGDAREKSEERWSANLVGDCGEHEHRVSKVDWNVTGTILTSSGADGAVRLWKASMGGVWRPMGSITAKQGAAGVEGMATGSHSKGGSGEDVVMDG